VPAVSFSQSTITSVNRPVQNGTQLLLSWTSSVPAGTFFQVYVDRQLVWRGVGRSCSIPAPTAISRIDIGSVDSSEAQTDLSAELPPAPARQAMLSWLGGTYQGEDIAGFHIYGEPIAGGGIDYSTVLATVPAYVAGIITDGFGYGGFGQGAFAESAGSYSWTSPPLSAGTWYWCVKPFDTAGNEGPGQAATVTITAPPLSPTPFSDMTRLHYTYNIADNATTISWNPTPG
jgi:hypothetical protein